MLVGVIQQAGWAMSCYKILSTKGAKFFVSRIDVHVSQLIVHIHVNGVLG